MQIDVMDSFLAMKLIQMEHFDGLMTLKKAETTTIKSALYQIDFLNFRTALLLLCRWFMFGYAK